MTIPKNGASDDQLLAWFYTEHAHRFPRSVASFVKTVLPFRHLPDGARPSIGLIAEKAGMSRRSVNNAITELTKAYLLEVEPRTDGDNRPLPNRYYLFPTILGSAPEPRLLSSLDVQNCLPRSPDVQMHLPSSLDVQKSARDRDISTKRIDISKGVDISNELHISGEEIDISKLYLYAEAELATEITRGPRCGGLRPPSADFFQGVGISASDISTQETNTDITEVDEITEDEVGGGLRPPPEHLDDAKESHGEPRTWPTRSDPMPIRRTHRTSSHDGLTWMLERENEIHWLTSYFEGLILIRDNKIAGDKGRKPKLTVGPHRLTKFERAVRALLTGNQSPNLAEVVMVLDALFTRWSGFMAVPMDKDEGYPCDGRITNFWMITNYYAELLEAVSTPATLPKQLPVVQIVQAEQTNQTEQTNQIDLAQITKLVELFTRYRLAWEHNSDETHHTRIKAWHDDFMLMLATIPFDDLNLVLTALADRRYPEQLDYYSFRYIDACDLVRDPGEFPDVLANVHLGELKEQKRKERLEAQPVKPPVQYFAPPPRHLTAIA